MPQSPFIQVLLKRTDDVDWVSPLKRYIANLYQEDPDNYTAECATLQQLRNDVRGAGADSTGLDIFYKYYRQLELLDLRFPVDEKDNHVKVHFTWYDALTGRATAQYSLAYEKACVIFNIAATLTAMAAAQTRSEVDGLKKAYRYLQCAAGVFNFINDNFLHAPSTDLSRESVKTLSQLALAQAQECMFEKCLGEKKKAGLIAKIAAHAAEEYAKIADMLADFEKKGWVEKSWLRLVQTKASFFNSLAQYNKGVALEIEGQYGEALARVTVAEALAKEASRISREFSSAWNNSLTMPSDAAVSLTEMTKSNLAVVSEKKAKQKHDNDMIYHASVPNTDTLPSVEKQPLVVPIGLTELYPPLEAQKIVGVDMFQRLIPLSVHQSASVYSEETAKLLRAEQEKSDVADAELTAAMEYMRLPGALDKFRDQADGQYSGVIALAEPPIDVREAARDVAQAEGQEPVADLIRSLETLRTEATRMMDEIRQSLDMEQRECESLRVKYNELWDQSPSGPLTSSIRHDLRLHGEAMDRAMSADKSTLARWEAIRGNVELMSRGPEALQRAFSEAVATAVSSARSAGNGKKPTVSLLDVDVSVEDSMLVKISKVEECMSKLNRLKKDRLDTLKDLKTMVHQDDISQLLVLNRNSNVESQIFQSALEKFRGHQTRLAAATHHQQALIQELTKAYKALLQQEEGRRLQMEWDAVERSRVDLGEQLKGTAGAYKAVKASVGQAIEFYTNITNLIRTVSRTTREYVNRRAEERNALVEKLETTRSEREQQVLKERLSRLTSPYFTPAPGPFHSYPGPPPAPSPEAQWGVTPSLATWGSSSTPAPYHHAQSQIQQQYPSCPAPPSSLPPPHQPSSTLHGSFPATSELYPGPPPAPTLGNRWVGTPAVATWGSSSAPAPYLQVQPQIQQQYYSNPTTPSSLPPPTQPSSNPQHGGFPTTSGPYEHGPPRPSQPPTESYQHYPTPSFHPGAIPTPVLPLPPGMGPPPVPMPPPRPPYPGVGGDNESLL